MGLFTHMNKEWTNVKFLTLSDVNGTPMGLAHIRYDDFLWEMMKHYKTHMHWRWGADIGKKAHAHIIVSVPTDELKRFWEKDKTFSPYRNYPFKQVWYKDWRDGHKTEGYACEKHTRMTDKARCPQRSKPCKKGRCSHNIVA